MAHFFLKKDKDKERERERERERDEIGTLRGGQSILKNGPFTASISLYFCLLIATDCK